MNVYGNLTRLNLELFKRAISIKQKKILQPSEIGNFILKKFNNTCSVGYNDLSFTVADEGFLKQLHDNCWWGQPTISYGTDTGDCENYAEFFNGMVALMWKINTMGIAYGEMKIGGKWLPHAFCIPILLNEKGELEAWMYDPLMNISVHIDDYKKIEDMGYQWRVGHIDYH